jgi:hypothetical protein
MNQLITTMKHDLELERFERSLKRAQDRLKNAIESGAPKEEIRDLNDEVTVFQTAVETMRYRIMT